MRINKYLAEAGVASRRKSDELIKQGLVKVNGIVLKELGYDTKDGDVVEVSGTIVSPARENVYALLNKPTGYVTTTSDEFGRPTVMDLLRNEYGRIYPVGRLDQNTSGLIIMTNDGKLANRVMHPSNSFDKTYRALVKGDFLERHAARLERGVDIGGFVTSPASVTIVKGLKNSTLVDITIHEGKNHQVRRMFKAIGFPVQELQRTKIGKITIGRLAVGQYRKLSKEEIEYLKNV